MKEQSRLIMQKSFRLSKDRGFSDHGWLQSYHTFSFSSYHSPEHMGFRDLRVINEDLIAPSQGFATHGHRDMEIISYVLSGQLEHKDSMGNGSVIHAGEFQYMSAGSGVRHSEFNPSTDTTCHLLQIWILPNVLNVEPRYAEKKVNDSEKLNQFKLIFSENGQNNSVSIKQDILIYVSKLNPQCHQNFKIEKTRHAWIHVTTGEVFVNSEMLAAGDAIAISDTQQIDIKTNTNSGEILIFDMK